jgi:hypothetical protein
MRCVNPGQGHARRASIEVGRARELLGQATATRARALTTRTGLTTPLAVAPHSGNVSRGRARRSALSLRKETLARAFLTGVFCLQVSRATPTGAPRSALRGAGDIFSCGTDERNSALGAGKTFSHALIFSRKKRLLPLLSTQSLRPIQHHIRCHRHHESRSVGIRVVKISLLII